MIILENIWSFISKKFESNQSVVLFVVVKTQGSTPGRLGFKMVIARDSSQFGTIGGGVMELNFVKKAHQLLINNESGFIFKVQIHHAYAPKEQQSGLICSGEERIIYGILAPSQENKLICQEIQNESEKSRKLQISPSTINIITSNETTKEENRYNFHFKSETDWLFEEDINYKNFLYIFGSGHVGLSMSKIFSMLDFYVIIIDNRKDVATLRDNSFANKIITDDYSNAGKYIHEGNSTYIAVVTTSMIMDVEALTSCIQKNVRYIGVMGSKSKKNEIYTRLRKIGISEELINKIQCPIGINGLKSNTAEEIAISVAAQVIMIKNTFNLA